MLHYRHIELNYLGIDTWYVNVGPYSPLFDREEVDMAELLRYSVVRMPGDYSSDLAFYLFIGGVSLTKFKKVEYTSDNATMPNLLRYTDVFRLGPGISGEDSAAHRIETIPIKSCETIISVTWTRGKKGILSTSVQEFVQTLEEWVPEAIC